MSHIMTGDGKVWPCVIGGVVGGVMLGVGLAHVYLPSWCNPKPSSVTLMYFDGRGLAEVARQMLAVAGVSYNDKRYTFTVTDGEGPIFGRLSKPEMEADAKAGKFDANMGRLPVMCVDGVKIGGSKAIFRFIANMYGLNGSTAMEAAQIDCVCTLAWDISDAHGKETDKDKWFDGVGTAQGDRQLMWHLQQLEKCVGADGFAVGGKVSMADAVIYSKFGETCRNTAGLFGSPISEPMGDLSKVNAALSKFSPNVAKIVKQFEELPQMKAYLAARSKTTPMF